MYHVHEELKWEVEHVDLAEDLSDWRMLDTKTQNLIKHILAFFAAADGIVMENITSNFANDVQYYEARAYYVVQAYIENIHSLMYAKLLETYISDRNEKDRLFDAITTMPAIGAKAVWAEKWISEDAAFAKRLFAFAIVEGLFFSSAFATIYYIKSLRKMSGLCISNDYISRDEGMHVNFAAHLYNNHIINKLSQEEAEELMYEAVEVEKRFVEESIPEPLLGMNVSLMSQYVEFCAHQLMKQFGYTSKFVDVKCPFAFMDRIALNNQTAFFDQRPTEYKRDVSTSKVKDKINFDVDF